MGRSGIEHVRLGVVMNAVGLRDPSGSGIGKRRLHFEEGVLTKDGVIEFSSPFNENPQTLHSVLLEEVWYP